MARKLGVAVLSFAHFHAHSYSRCVRETAEAELVALYDDDPERGRRAAEQHGAELYTDLDRLLGREDVEAVIITAENVKHAELAIRAAEAGKHILCEKPIATRLEDADRMLRAVEKAGVVFQTCYVMRYHTAAALVKSLIDEGTIGKIFAMAGTNRLQRSLPATEPWFVDPELSGGGAVMDHTVHLADLMRWYTGSEAKTVYTLIAKNATPELRVEDTFTTLITFQDGALGTIDGSWCLPDSHPTWGEVAMAVYGTEGYIWLDAFRQNINLYGEKQLTWQYYGCDPDLAMVRGFVQAVLEDKTPTATGWDGRQGVEITLASYQSAREGRPVTLPL